MINIIITHSERALFDLNARVEAQGGIVPKASGTILPWASTRAFKSNSALSLCVIIILLCTIQMLHCERAKNISVI